MLINANYLNFNLHAKCDIGLVMQVFIKLCIPKIAPDPIFIGGQHGEQSLIQKRGKTPTEHSMFLRNMDARETRGSSYCLAINCAVFIFDYQHNQIGMISSMMLEHAPKV